jgi:hypothetical protein
MPIPAAEAKQLKIAVEPFDPLSQFEKPDYEIKPRILAFLHKNKDDAYCLDELYQQFVPLPEGPYPEPPELPTDAHSKEMYQLGINVARHTFFQVKLLELVDEGKLVARDKEGKAYFHVK